MEIGHYVQQPSGYKAFIPLSFPPEEPILLSCELELKHAEAMRLMGKLDGISQLLPDRDFFLLMFYRKESTSSSQIEGTQATMDDAIESEIAPSSALPVDVGDIIHYIRAIKYGEKRFETLPLSVRFILEMHEELMKGARSTQNPFPGEIRRSQNWIRGTSPSNARFVPPPPHEVPQALGDLEKFIHSKDKSYPPLIKAALIHAQFETIHPFVDGNGRAGRLLVTMFFWQEKLLGAPILYLSEFFQKHQNLYYSLLQGYHDTPAEIIPWIEFFIEGIQETALSAIDLVCKIYELREKDRGKIDQLSKPSAKNAVKILRNLYGQPIVDVAKIQEWTGFTRMGAQKVIDKLISLEILFQRHPHKSYGKTYEYRSYLQLFEK